MTKRVLTIVVAVFCCVPIPRPSYAECAWVLWETYNTRDWEARGGFSDGPSCKVAAQEKLTMLVKQNPGSSAGNDAATLRTATGAIYYHVRCLPDTIDPRGSKGK